jgi:hypothetical protein
VAGDLVREQALDSNGDWSYMKKYSVGSGQARTSEMTKRPAGSQSDAASLSAVQVEEVQSKSCKKSTQRKLTAKQLMKARRLKERDDKKAKKLKEQELRARYAALTPCRTTLDPSEREPVVGDKLIVRDEYNIKCAVWHFHQRLLCFLHDCCMLSLCEAATKCLPRDALLPGIRPRCSKRQVPRCF